ncbi:acylneuraminate cytidylyltransferase family protein [Methylorubrum extorquens]|uniref:N-acylneuraminate cytidylyltransferase n=1 Tax=Methylorubrum extorquens (strain CM4 / NCIMB 13688) TaxID=440085 RepID=B7KYP4_METC4|nr:acylneuraminate cytidylyltransferase family protein [Methylorubrum extorquens]ACK84795.1 N-acylneuraminate cytidylyltransferase [Methylorubrum extorquens CM4]
MTMLSDKRLCTICVRGGSKGVPGKNIRMLAGTPLLAHSILQARATGLFAAVAVSSDSPEILDIAGRYGADYLVERPPELATDAAPKLPVIRHCASAVEKSCGFRYDVFVDLGATSPLRLPADISACVARLRSEDADIVLTATHARHSPYFSMVRIGIERGVHLLMSTEPPPVRRQDTPECFDMNGSIYVWTRDALMSERGLFGSRTRLHIMPEERSADIDTELDWLLVETLMQRQLADAFTPG